MKYTCKQWRLPFAVNICAIWALTSETSPIKNDFTTPLLLCGINTVYEIVPTPRISTERKWVVNSGLLKWYILFKSSFTVSLFSRKAMRSSNSTKFIFFQLDFIMFTPRSIFNLPKQANRGMPPWWPEAPITIDMTVAFSSSPKQNFSLRCLQLRSNQPNIVCHNRTHFYSQNLKAKATKETYST